MQPFINKFSFFEDISLWKFIGRSFICLTLCVLSRINKNLSDFMESWNSHPIRTSNNKLLLQIWTEEFYTSKVFGSNLLDATTLEEELYGVYDYGPTPQLQTNNNVQVPEIDLALSYVENDYIHNNFDSLEEGGSFGKNAFSNLINYIELSGMSLFFQIELSKLNAL